VSPVAGEPVTGGPVIHRHCCMPKYYNEEQQKINQDVVHHELFEQNK
jgi:hypothetical protein